MLKFRAENKKLYVGILVLLIFVVLLGVNHALVITRRAHDRVAQERIHQEYDAELSLWLSEHDAVDFNAAMQEFGGYFAFNPYTLQVRNALDGADGRPFFFSGTVVDLDIIDEVYYMTLSLFRPDAYIILSCTKEHVDKILSLNKKDDTDDLWMTTISNNAKVIADIHHVVKAGISSSYEMHDGFAMPISTFSHKLIMRGQCIALQLNTISPFSLFF